VDNIYITIKLFTMFSINYNNINKITKQLNKLNIKYSIHFPYHYNSPKLIINLNQ